MRTLQTFLLITLSLVVFGFGCQQEARRSEPDKNASGATQPADSVAKEYPIQGKVVSVSPEGDSVTIDHQDIPGLMKAMEMDFQVENPQVLEKIAEGDEVQGQLRVQAGDYVITKLKPTGKE